MLISYLLRYHTVSRVHINKRSARALLLQGSLVSTSTHMKIEDRHSLFSVSRADRGCIFYSSNHAGSRRIVDRVPCVKWYRTLRFRTHCMYVRARIASTHKRVAPFRLYNVFREVFFIYTIGRRLTFAKITSLVNDLEEFSLFIKCNSLSKLSPRFLRRSTNPVILLMTVWFTLDSTRIYKPLFLVLVFVFFSINIRILLF